jgi:hypothetical protein
LGVQVSTEVFTHKLFYINKKVHGKAPGQGHSQNKQPSEAKGGGLVILGMPLPKGFTLHKNHCNNFFINITVIPSTGYHKKPFLNLNQHRVN